MYIILVIILSIVLIYVSAFYYNEKRLNDIFLNSINTPSNVNCNINKSFSKEGLDYFKTKKVVITGLLRNSSATIPILKNNIEKISRLFKDYKLLIVENDSSDDTREKLLKWADENNKVTILGCGINLKTCKLNLPKTVIKNKNKSRINKMVFLRNIPLDHINKNPKEFEDYEFLICIDMDIKGTVYNDGMGISGYHFKTKPELDGMCANGINVINFGVLNFFFYHDTYAHRDYNDNGFKFKRQPEIDDFFNVGAGLTLSVEKCNAKNELIPVKSCFNGFMIYRLSSLKGLNYELTINDKDEADCEHVTFNKKLKNVYFNPFLLFVVLKNGE